MNKGFSIWLDALRAAAALAVLFGHMAHIRFTRGDYYFLREINIASDAVIVFFVISGLVIAYAADRDGSAGRFAFNRVTRLWTVIVPALLLTMVFDAIGMHLDADAYPSPYYEPTGLMAFIGRGLTFSTEWSGLLDRVRLGTNGPLWSLSYEAAYYALFGVAVFCRGLVRIGLLALIALVAGIPILALLPAWALGVLVWRLVATGGAASIGRPMAFLLALGGPAILVLAKVASLPNVLASLTATAFAPVSRHAILGYSDEVLWNTLLAICIAGHLAGMARLLHGTRIRGAAFGAGAIRWIAGASFSIYATHYPTLHLLDAVMPADLPAHDVLLLGLTLIVGLVFAQLFERPIKVYRQMALHAANARRLEPRLSRQGIPRDQVRMVSGAGQLD